MPRADRMQEELRQLISLIIQQDLKDPRIGFVTITRVDVSPDLKNAKAYFTTIEEDKSFEDTLKGLNSSVGFIRKLIGQRLMIKFIPKINFAYDDSQAVNDNIDRIIEEIRKEREERYESG